LIYCVLYHNYDEIVVPYDHQNHIYYI